MFQIFSYLKLKKKIFKIFKFQRKLQRSEISFFLSQLHKSLNKFCLKIVKLEFKFNKINFFPEISLFQIRNSHFYDLNILSPLPFFHSLHCTALYCIIVPNHSSNHFFMFSLLCSFYSFMHLPFSAYGQLAAPLFMQEKT